MAHALRAGYIPSNNGPAYASGSGSGLSGSGSGSGSSASMAQSFDNLAGSLGTALGSSGTLMGDILRESQGIAQRNSALSQSYAQEQMAYQTASDRYAMNWSASEAAKNREWQEQMSNTAHQREVQDLLAAGLNPILSANNGAAVGSGATGQAFTSAGAKGDVDMTNALNVAQGFFSDMLNSALTMASLGVSAQNAQLSADAMTRVAGINAGASMYASDNALQASREGHSSDQFQTNLRIKSQENIAKWANDVALEGQKRSGFVGSTIQAVNDLANVSEGMVNKVIKEPYAYLKNEFRKKYEKLSGKAGGSGTKFEYPSWYKK